MRSISCTKVPADERRTMLDGSNRRDLTGPAVTGMPAASTVISHTARAEETVAECDEAYRVALIEAGDLEAELVAVTATPVSTPMGVLLAHDRVRRRRCPAATAASIAGHLAALQP
jgi:hypothetical protein